MYETERERSSMLEAANRTIGYFCPACRQAIIVERSAFELAASRSRIECPCKGSALQVELLENRVRLTVPCLLCEKEHLVTCSPQAFLHQKILAFSCGASGLDCCYVGDRTPVYHAMERLQETIDVLETEAASSGMFLNDMVMEEVLEELRDIGQRGGISCTCGSKNWSLAIQFSAVELRCTQCGGNLKIPAATASDLEDLCCKHTLTIRGRDL